VSAAPWQRWALGLAAAAGCFAFAGEGLASPDYPAAIASHLALSYTPACTICHSNNLGGIGTVTRPFGIAMREHGLVSGSEPSLFAALDSMAADGTDSACDGTPDIVDLKAGRDPNVPDGDGGTGACGQTLSPRYGCGAQIAPGSGGEPPAVVSGTMLALAACGAGLRRLRAGSRRA
jgi:hypothetical protein